MIFYDINNYNKCSDKGTGVYFPALLGYYDSQTDRLTDRPPDQQTDRPDHREVTFR